VSWVHEARRRRKSCLIDSLKGYTSLGGKLDTYPNPHLKKEGENGEGFRPAYDLLADDEERLGRDG
jgi:hypothetical protein